MNVISKLVQNPETTQQYFESKKKSLTYNLKISFLIKGLKKSHRNKFNYDVSVGKVKKLNKRDLIPEY
jgi:hypothetical protein